MPEQLGREFTERLARSESVLSKVTEESAGQIYEGGEWLRKEVLGHLLDSSINNHVRFTAAAIAGAYTGPSYAQNGWVSLHGYAGMTWMELLAQWRLRNALLARVVTNIPESALETECRVGNGDPVTLQFLIVDYLDHMEHHIAQICA